MDNQIPENAMTVHKYRIRYKCGATKARDDLNMMAEAGELVKYVVLVGQQYVAYYIQPDPAVKSSHAPSRRGSARRR